MKLTDLVGDYWTFQFIILEHVKVCKISPGSLARTDCLSRVSIVSTSGLDYSSNILSWSTLVIQVVPRTYQDKGTWRSICYYKKPWIIKQCYWAVWVCVRGIFTNRLLWEDEMCAFFTLGERANVEASYSYASVTSFSSWIHIVVLN